MLPLWHLHVLYLLTCVTMTSARALLLFCLQIVIPFFSLFVKDMYFLNEGCANRIESGQVNFGKFWELAKQITEFLSWKQVEVSASHELVLTSLMK